MLAASVPNLVYARQVHGILDKMAPASGRPHDRYPAIALEVTSEIVGVSHFDLPKLKTLVDARPELAKAVWDWGFGDWESAIAAASHVGRKDIIDYLMSRGAVPTIFTFAVLGEYQVVRAMISARPGIQRNFGPHGITLLQHARTGLSTDGADRSGAQKLVDYLQELGDADGPQYLELADVEKEKFLGDYRYGDGAEDGFTIRLNMRKMIALGRLGKSGGTLWRIGENEFTYQGAPSVTVRFLLEQGKVVSLNLREPGLELVALKQ
jgi:hypothetical protein